MLMSHAQYIEQSFRDHDTFVAQLGESPPSDVRELWDMSREMTARVSWKPYMFNRRLGPLLQASRSLPAPATWSSSKNRITSRR